MVSPERLNRSHYQPQINDPEAAKKLLGRVEKMDSGCWIWTGCTDAKGYGRIRYAGKMYWVHRFSHALFFGEVPEGWHVHHKCHTKDCVNPDHLEAITESENSKERWER